MVLTTYVYIYIYIYMYLYASERGCWRQKSLQCPKSQLGKMSQRLVLEWKAPSGRHLVAQAKVLRKSGCTSCFAERKAPLWLRQRFHANLVEGV